jgi:sigma-B regulation protein RsbU (phosphoserine phosphatase)
MKSKHNLVIGAFKEARYRNFEFVLEKGDKLFLFTDGLTEATDSHDQ